MATIKNFPNNADEYIGAENVMKWLHGRTSGVFGADENLSVAAVAEEMAVDVSDGLGWMADANADGTVFWNDTQAVSGSKLRLVPEIASAVLPRIDRVVVQWETSDYVAKPEIIILKGTAAGTPAPPALTNNSVLRQISLAKIRLPAGASALTDDLVTDERLDAAVCGLVTDAVGVDTTTMQAQFDALLARIETELARLNSGTEVMLKSDYDTNGKREDIYEYVDSVSQASRDKLDKLWQNAKPTDSFASQTLAMDLSDYDYILVQMRLSSSSTTSAMHIVLINSTSHGLANMQNNISRRFCSASTSQVYFGTGTLISTYGTATDDDTRMIPYVIYGVKMGG